MFQVVQPETVGLSSERLQRVSRWMAQQVSGERLAGLSVLVHRRGQVAFSECAGEMDVEAGKPLQDDTIFRIYSMTKPITAVAAMMLYEEGCFQLDDPIASYLPEFNDMQVWAGGEPGQIRTVPAEAPITVRHLFTHTAGLTYGFMEATAVDAYYRDHKIEFNPGSGSLADVVKRLADAPLLCQPGSQWNYSVAIDVLGRLVEVWSGMSLEQFFESRILQPLGMADTAFHVADSKLDRFAALYSPVDGSKLQVNAPQAFARDTRGRGLKLIDAPDESTYTRPASVFSGGGGLTGTMADYARFCQMLLRGGELDGVRLLSRKTVEFIASNHLPEGNDMAALGQPIWSETSTDGIGYGLGMAVTLNPAQAQVMGSVGEYHWGGAASTGFWIDPAEDMFVVLMTQLMPSSAYPLRRELRVLTYQSIID